MASPVEPVGQVVGMDEDHPAVGARQLLVDVPGGQGLGELPVR